MKLLEAVLVVDIIRPARRRLYTSRFLDMVSPKEGKEQKQDSTESGF